MDEQAASEIREIRRRLTEIDDERGHIPAGDTKRSEELLDEEHRLETRLAELEDQAVEGEAGEAEEEAAAQTDLTRTPKLPDTEPNSEGGSDNRDRE